MSKTVKCTQEHTFIIMEEGDELEAKKYIGQQVKFLVRGDVMDSTIPAYHNHELKAIQLDADGTWYVNDRDDYHCAIAVEVLL